MSGGQMPSKSANVKNPEQYEALKDKGMSKERGRRSRTRPARRSEAAKVGQRRQLAAGRDDRTAQSRRPQGRSGDGQEALTGDR